MMIKKLIICLSSFLCLTACKGWKVDYEKFKNQVSNIKETNDITKAKVTYSSVIKEYDLSLEDIEKEKYEGNYYRKSESGDWITDDGFSSLFYEFCDYYERYMLSSIVNNLKEDNEKYEIKYYVNPFGYEKKYELSEDDGNIIKEYAYYEWNEYGYLTVLKQKFNYAKEGFERYSEVNFKVSYE